MNEKNIVHKLKDGKITQRIGNFFYQETPDGYGEWSTPDGNPPSCFLMTLMIKKYQLFNMISKMFRRC
jgi:hypothetical protein